jgi:hypothetical protein
MTDEGAKPSPEFERFQEIVDKVLSVPGAAVKQKIREQRERSSRDPNRRGPKAKNRPVPDVRGEG